MDIKTIKHYLHQLELCEQDFDVASEAMDLLLQEKINTVFKYTNAITRKLFLKKASRLIQESKYEIARPILENLITYVKPYENDKEDYKQFQNIFEYYYYITSCKDDHDITMPEEPMLYYMLFYGLLLVQTKQYDDALAMLEKVIKFNPYCAEAYFEMADVYRKQDKLDKFYATTLRVYEIAYDPAVLAKYYRNIGYYFVEMKDYTFATMAYFVSSHYEKHPNVTHELAYISTIINEDIIAPTLFEIQEAFFEKELNPVPYEKIVIFLISLAEMLEDDDTSSAIFLYEMYANLTENEEIRQRIKDLRRKIKLNA